MKRSSIGLLFLLGYVFCYSQNLAPNPGFDIATGCVTGNTWTSVNSWRVPASHGGSPDRFDVCAPGTFGVPSNVFGSQSPRSGNAYVGFVTHFGSNGLFREYLQAPLTTPLIAGQSYTASAYISLSDGSGWATDGLGFHFAVGAISGTGGNGPLPFTPQVACATNNFMNDKIGWMLVTGNFVATSAFNYVTFGNFKADAATNVQVQASGWAWNYTYMDDISVTPAVILSADMGELRGEVIDDAGALAWETQRELGTQAFIVERSLGDLQHFEVIGRVSAQGGPATTAHYAFQDPGLAPTALNYYRVQEVDQNGAGGYSGTIELHTSALADELSLHAYPNPVAIGHDLLVQIRCTKPQMLRAEVIDLHGRTVQTQAIEVTAGENVATLGTSSLAPACYVLRVSSEGHTATRRFIVSN